ncbi:MmpS family transport accessory protein [Streptomyces marokkonensis]|uniref:MmpS family transport accessory protein n=1 Tax=Streptomyces marokkonensis TaxID=324855 RepID=A0ABW6Q623_9ACTN
MADGAQKSEGEGEGSGGRAGVVIAAVLLLACAGLVGYGLLDTEDEPEKSTAPTAAVTYEVTGDGAAEISFLGRDEDGTATVVRDAELPWKRTVQVPLGKRPTVAVVLGEKGGQASCTLAIRGKHVQRATAMGEFGRATCAGELPAGEPAAGGS